MKSILLATLLWLVPVTALAAGQPPRDDGAMPIEIPDDGSGGGGVPPAPPAVVTQDYAGNIFLWTQTGVLQAGWPVVLPGLYPYGMPKLQDLDGDGTPEIVCLMGLMAGQTGSPGLYAWRQNGQLYASWTTASYSIVSGMRDTPEMGNITGGGSQAWVWANGGAVLACLAGSPSAYLSGFPKAVSPVLVPYMLIRLADVDQNGIKSVLGMIPYSTGMWFILRDVGGTPASQVYTTANRPSDAPNAADIVPGGAQEVLLAMWDRLECDAQSGGAWSAMAGRCASAATPNGTIWDLRRASWYPARARGSSPHIPRRGSFHAPGSTGSSWARSGA